MPLLNYTTSIAPERTTAQIVKMLAKAGASAILTDYENGEPVALSFKLKMNNQEIGFKLPTDWRPVLEVLKEQRQRNSNVRADAAQAQRVAWRIVKDWVEAQLAIIETRMVTPAQVFLPYAITQNGQTMYEYIASNPGLLLGPGGQ